MVQVIVMVIGLLVVFSNVPWEKVTRPSVTGASSVR
jgi:hypothetical protein